MGIQHIERLLCYWRHSLCGLELNERLTGELWPQTRIGHSVIQHCVGILQAHTYIAVWCATVHDNKTHTPYD